MNTLTPQQAKILQALLEGKSITAAARDHGVHRATIHNWCGEHTQFAKALAAGRVLIQARLFDELHDLADNAIGAIRQIVNDEKAPASVRLKAAISVFNVIQSAHHRPPAPADQTEPPKAANETKPPQAANETQPPQAANETNPKPVTVRYASPPPGRNERCPCGSQMKYKRCCWEKQAA